MSSTHASKRSTMGKGGGRSKNKMRRSTGTLPRGIPHKKGGVLGSSSSSGGNNPFDFARTKNSASRVKHPVHNKLVPGAQRGNGIDGKGMIVHQHIGVVSETDVPKLMAMLGQRP